MNEESKPVITRCKFCCNSAKPSEQDPELWNYLFHAVYSSDPNSENAQYWKYTPSGQLAFQSMHPQQFEVGKEYYLDLRLA